MNEPKKNDQIRYKKALGQNFIFDKNLLDAVVSDAGVSRDDVVLEIGAGAGTLTARIADKADRVVSVEIDRSLEPFLQGNLDAHDNIKLVFEDILKLSHNQILELVSDVKSIGDGGKSEKSSKSGNIGENIDGNTGRNTGGNIDGNTGGFKVVANLPYYITTPVIFHLLESSLPIVSMTVTVQKEVAERMTARPSTPEYGALTLAIKARAETKLTRHINRRMFTPAPNVDSAVVRMDIVREYNPRLSRVIKSLFASRRKTILNNLQQSFALSRAECVDALKKAGISESARGEQLDLAEVIALAAALDN